MRRSSAVGLATLCGASVIIGFIACATHDEDNPNVSIDASSKDSDDGAAADGSSSSDPVDPEGPAPTLIDAGCVDAAFLESFEDPSFKAVWSTSVADDGAAIGIDTAAYVKEPSSLRANVDVLGSGRAYATRSVCPASTGIVTCSFGLRIDLKSGGDVAIIDLRGTGLSGGYAVARLKAREILFLTPTDGGERVDRAPISLIDLLPGTFHNIELEVSTSEYSVKVDGLTKATLAVPAPGLSLNQIRAGILYSSTKRDPGWDLHIDELRCSFR